MALTPEQEAAYALDYGVARDGLRPDARTEYDRQLEARRRGGQERPDEPVTGRAGRSSDGGMPYRVSSPAAQAGSTIGFSLFFFLEIGAFFDRNGTQPGEIAFTSLLLAACAWLAIRGARSATLLADDDKVTFRGLLRTRSWSWQQIAGFVVETRRFGQMQYRRRVLGLRLQDGSIRWLSELNCRVPRGQQPSWVDDASAVLSAYLSGRRPGNASPDD